VLSRVAPPDRAERALDALEARLVDDDNGLIRLLTPPFDRTPHDPGYIKGYVPGVRENGGQYTHGVLWAVRAMAEAGRSDRAAELLEMLLPVHHGSGEGVERYQVEPYVVAADVYGTPPHVGRGGWTWYTGSAGWLYRIALESILGLEVERGCRLRLRPGLPSSWPGFRIAYRPPGTGAEYRIEVRRGEGEPARATVDGEAVELREGAVVVELVDDGIHDVVITDGPELGRRYAPTEGRDGSG
jgi:cellobiose phosphorylase